jgi:hypothetical protein
MERTTKKRLNGLCKSVSRLLPDGIGVEWESRYSYKAVDVCYRFDGKMVPSGQTLVAGTAGELDLYLSAMQAALFLAREAPREPTSPFAGDAGAQLIQETLTDRGCKGVHEAMVAYVERGDGRDFWMDFVGPMVDRAGEAIGVGVHGDGVTVWR